MQQHQARLLDLVDDGVVGTDADFRITHWNPGAEQLYGFAAADVLGRPANEVATFRGDDQRERLERELLEHGRSRTELTAVRGDGMPIEVEAVVSAIHDDAGELCGYVGIHRDVTERRRVARRLEQLSAVVADSQDAVCFADLDGRVAFVNDAGLRLLGLHDLSQADGRDVADLFAEHDRPRVRDELLPDVMRGDRRTEQLDLHDFAGGPPVPVSCQAFRVDDRASARPLGIATVSRDLRPSLRQDELLRESRRRTTAVLESVTDPLLGLDGDLRLTFLNAGAARLIARLRGEQPRHEPLIGAHALTVLPALLGAPVERAAAAAQAERRAVDAGRHRDEVGGWWQVRVHPADDGVSVLLRDVSDWHAAEEAGARRVEQQAVVARLGARSGRTDDLGRFLDDAVRRIGRAVGATFALFAERSPVGDRLLLRAGAGFEHEGAMVVGTTDAGDLFGRALADGAVVVDDVLAAGVDVAPALRSHRPAAGAIVPVAGQDEVFGALGVFSHAGPRLAPPDVTYLQAAAHALAAAIERSRTSRRLEQTRDAERRRMARALHDEALQDARYALARAEDPPAGSQRDDLLVDALTRIGGALSSAVYDLRLAEEDRPLEDLLAELVELHRRMAPDLQVDLQVAGMPERPPRRTSDDLLHIVGEALTNVRRHADAHRVRVRTWTTGGQLWCDVTDDGRGVDAHAVSGNGIAGMHERAARHGGQVTVRTPAAGGTAVGVRLPLTSSPATPAPIRVLLVEDHAAVREAIAAALRSEPDFDVVGEAATLAEARGLLDGVDVAVVDLGLPDGDGTDLIAELRDAEPGAHALVLSAGLDRVVLARAVERGAAGALPKTTSLPDVLDAVRRVRAGETLLPLDEVVELLRFASRERERELLDRRAIESLTPREREILQLIADGCDSHGAAARLHISVRTQRNHVASILAKLGVHSQLQALIFALRYQLVELRPAAG
ncbi:PAS domain-containing protein [Conexibacter sp. SYSU D00693]|uniref:PAS domain-containing protein n=1 Tax=Conexibacter sp. SYSU D00693 TaxID=2812560 RepID=UPI00196B8648|nr:PAS domain-containing protein [Conexibacter sp. SYSU D00693]